MKITWTTFINNSSLRSLLVICGILAVGFFLRFSHPDYYPIGFDQVQILQNAQQIRHGHFVLLGPRTGPAPMFTGPLIYYVAAALLQIIPNPYVLVLVSLTFYAVTFLTILWLGRKYLKDEIFTWLFLAIYTFSPYQVSLDRVPWNPNLTFLAAILVFLPLLPKIGKKLGKMEFLFVLAGCFFGYQAHFSGLLLPGFVLVAWLLWYRNQWLLPLVSGFGILASLLPTALFDYRHQFLNLQGLLFILKERGSTANAGAYFWVRLFKDVLITFENMGKVVTFTSPYPILIAVGALIFCLFILKFKNAKSSFWWSLIWIFGLDFIFMFYKGSKPEYYFLLQFPALFYVLTKIVKPAFLTYPRAIAAITGFGLYSILSLNYQQKNVPPLFLENQLQAAKQVRNYQHQTNSLVVYDMKDVDSVGIKYLLADLPSGAATNLIQTTHLVYPYNHDSPVNYSYGQLAIWQDPRTDVQKNYLVRQQVIFSTPESIRLLESHYPLKQLASADTLYIIQQNQQNIGQLFFVDDKVANGTYNTFMESFNKQWDPGQKKWQLVKIEEKPYYVRSAAGTTMILSISDAIPDLPSQLNFLKNFDIL